MTTEVAERKVTPAAVFSGQIEKMRGQIQAALPQHVSLDKFVRVVMNAVQTAPILLNCDRSSLLRACIEAATDGLIPDGREGAIVPYKNKAQWLPMVWGLVKLTRQSGELQTISAHIVRDGDAFEHWVDEDGEHFKHVPAYDAESKAMRLVYACARTKDGGVYFEAMSAAEIDKFRKLSRAQSAESPWNTWPEEMAKARVLKRLCKRLPLNVDAIAAIERDNLREAAELGTAHKSNVIEMMNQQIAGAGTAAEHGDAEVIEVTPAPPPADDQAGDFLADMAAAEK